MTKQEVSLILEPTNKNPTFKNYGLGLMTEKERLFLHKQKVIKAVRPISGEVSDTIIDPIEFNNYFALKKEIERDRKYRRESGIEHLNNP